LNDLKSDIDGPPMPEPRIGGPAVAGASFNISGVPNALNKDCMLSAPLFNSANASEPFDEICSSDTTAKFSVTRNFKAFDAYNNKPIIPNTISIIVPGFMVS